MEKICIVKRRSSISNGLRQNRAFVPVDNREVYGGTDYEFGNLADVESDDLSLNLTSEQSELITSNEHLKSFADHETKSFVLNMKKVDGQTFLNFHFGDAGSMKLLKTKEACQMLQVSTGFLMKLVREKKLKSYKFGRIRRFSFQDVLDYLTENIEK
ncbi:MAG: helix-turn-helix domain-containing protein [Candidatus Scalindua rubra]|uniref:Helix-turn-helix domain protein n=1 Tax=Candidatus Scalindua brodae TaxID=237368 RepID=A0A0B0EEY9_9BACT|nr:MAG: Helix-turn-helix domain protein [Candidatus Scalindua brodae]MBZ0108812.1 helix-turn-helix domain-containing protein [Candidatus Scalindua rubra]TWU34709.1 Helix-turn-helix domain protein [Candidatus Brocadiaceae bacterium S225]